MKKKVSLFLSILSCIVLLAACGTANSASADYNGVTYDQLYQQAVSAGTILADATEEQITEQVLYLEANYGDEAALDIELYTKWLEAMEEAGKYVSYDAGSFVVAKSGKTLTTDLTLVFEQRNVIFQLVYNYHDMELTGITINPVYSFGEKMAKAGMNTVISISIVFTVLIIISLIISCFKVFPYLEAKKKEKENALKAAETPKVDSFVEQIEQREEQIEQIEQVEQMEQLADDTELAAVIAAAVAAYEGTSADGFVVRSIRRR